LRDRPSFRFGRSEAGATSALPIERDGMTDSTRLDDGTAPVFVVGTGRCGSTIVDSVLSMHPAFSWMPSWVDTFRVPELAVVNRLWALPGTDEYRLRRYFPTPIEPYQTFRRYDSEFWTEEITEDGIRSARRHIVPLIRRLCRAHGNPRFLGKLVGRPVKVNLFHHLYPDAYFVHVTRELKPTLSSLLKVDFYTDWGRHLDEWPWEKIPAPLLDFYERTGRSNLIGAAIGLYLNRRKVDEQLQAVDRDHVLEIPYAGFVEDPVASARAIAGRLHLDFSDAFADRIAARSIYGGADEKWRRHLKADVSDQIDALQELIDAGSG